MLQYIPDGQIVGEELAAEQKLPAGQANGEDALAGQNAAAGHACRAAPPPAQKYPGVQFPEPANDVEREGQ
jgi:hypothetical protein